MASNNQAPALVVIALLLFAAANPLCHGVVNNLLSGLTVNGHLCCTANGNCEAGATGIVGAPVKLICTNILGAAVTVGQGSTVANGTFTIRVSNLQSVLGGLLNPTSPIPCNVVVELPLNQAICPILSIVDGILSALSTLQSITGRGDLRVGGATALAFSVNATIPA